ncbi:MAG: methyltransferase domain-containing protein [Caldilineae bacterium]|nr:MAG: methyltransferase domain-containing protein [Caldilineae bacterium]
MTIEEPKQIKEKVRERYGAIALQQSSCCGPSSALPAAATSCCGDEMAEVRFVDYGELKEETVPEADLGLGCGIPTHFAGLQCGETVLDLGSGAGIDVFLAARAVGPEGRVIGVDMTPEMIELARENACKAGFQNVEFRQGEIEALPIEDESIDVVLSNCVINLVPDKRRAFAEIYRVLKSGGRFSISDMVTYGDVPDTIRQDIALWTGCIAGALDRDVYLELIREAGFREVRVESETRHAASEYLNVDDDTFGIASITVVGRK